MAHPRGRAVLIKTRPRPVPPPGAIASASLPGYRRAGGGVGRVDPLPPTAPPPPPVFRALQSFVWLCVLGRASRSFSGPAKLRLAASSVGRLAHVAFATLASPPSLRPCQTRFSDP